MSEERVIIRAKELSKEDVYFQEQDRKRLEELKARSANASNQKYRDEHRNHCFRCGTPSLAEVDYRGIKIDLCINEQCGAVHLDPGEMEKILAGDKGAVRQGEDVARLGFQVSDPVSPGKSVCPWEPRGLAGHSENRGGTNG